MVSRWPGAQLFWPVVPQLPSAHRDYGVLQFSRPASNAAVLLISVGAITWEAVIRLKHPGAVEETTVSWVAADGIAINGGTALLFMAGRKGDLNIRGAFVHLAGDAVSALGVVLTGLVMLYTGWI